MKTLTLATLLILTSLQLAATNYFVKANGGTGAGTSDATAWSFASFMTRNTTLTLGDSVFFKRGDEFTTTSALSLSGGVYYGTYGNGAAPVISGFRTLSSWTNEGANVWSVSLAYDCDFVLFDGIQTGKGRYPKGAYNFLTYENFGKNNDSSGYLVDDQLTGTPNWQGATAVTRAGGQEWQRKVVLSQSATQLNFATPEGWWSKGYGYFFQNHPNILTSALGAITGDWYYNKAANKFYMYFADNKPNAHEVKVPLSTPVITIPSRIGVTLDGLYVEGGASGIAIAKACTNINVQNCTVKYCNDGITATGASTQCTIGRNNVSYCINYGISGPITPTYYTIENNNVYHIGMIPGAMAGGPASGSAIYFEGGTGFVVRRNRIDTVGFIGIRCLRGKDILVEENVVKNFGYTKDDNGGFYAWSAEKDNSYERYTNRVVRRNIFVNGRAEGRFGANGAARQGGMYTDSRVHHVLFDGNIVDNMFGFGFVSVGGCRDLTITNNIFFRITRAGMTFNISSQNAEITCSGNVVHCINSAPGFALRAPTGNYSTVSSNDNIYLTNSNTAFQTTGALSGDKTLAQFQSAFSLESGSTWKQTDGSEILIYNEHTTDTTFNFPGKQYVNVKTGEPVLNKITLAPFTGVVLTSRGRR